MKKLLTAVAFVILMMFGFAAPASAAPEARITTNMSAHVTLAGVSKTGTYVNPISATVPAYSNVPVGTRYYVPNLRKYFVVDQLCTVNCRTLLSVAVAGFPTRGGITPAECAARISGMHLFIKNPDSNYLVARGAIGDRCVQYGETVYRAG